MHAPEMLDEEVLAVEDVEVSLGWLGAGGGG